MLLHAPWGGRLDGIAVLDAFAGTGALGLEALSRGAESAVFMERDRTALAVLRANVADCQGAAAQVIATDVLHPPPGRPCGLAFLDPPYGAGLLPTALTALARAGWLAPGALLVAEAARDEVPALGELLAERTHGAGRISIWRMFPVS
jgi:16S rRNA (guanine966-N2)-methyltransferase